MIKKSILLQSLCYKRSSGFQYQTQRIFKWFSHCRVILFSNVHQHFYSHEAKLNIKTNYVENRVNKFCHRSHTCGELNSNHIGEKVILCGWVEFKRMDKFIVLRDAYGSTQVIVHEEDKDTQEKLKDLSFETVLKVEGKVIPRPKSQFNLKMKTGEIEVMIDNVEILNVAATQLPFLVSDYNKAKESLQMEYRYLGLRFSEMQKNLRIRSWITMKMREYLINKCCFVDVETPTLFRKTPGGAQEFVVPTRFPNKFYSLVQSPQQFKQMLMVGGIDRYFQFARCYRDEGSRSDRQPEFTQLDIEMSFTDRNAVLELIEKLIYYSWPEFLEPLKIPFKQLTYEESMELYGSESPDLRIPYTIQNLSTISHKDSNASLHPCIYALKFPGKKEFLTSMVRSKLSKKVKEQFPDGEAKLIQANNVDAFLKDLKKLFSENQAKDIIDTLDFKCDDISFLTCGTLYEARRILGLLRTEFADIIESKGQSIRISDDKFVWIIDFPLMNINKTTKVLEASHHPFTQPHPLDIEFLYSDPLKVRGLHYDLVLNGSEIGGGSIRIHKRNLQEEIFKILGINPSEMDHLLNALSCGAPPHGGIAIGLDRYVSIICRCSSIRDVIAFPKTMEGKDLMSGAPVNISEEDKKFYHIEVHS